MTENMTTEGKILIGKNYPPKNIIDWDITKATDIMTDVIVSYEEEISGKTYTTKIIVQIECNDVWAIAGQWDIGATPNALRLYASKPLTTPSSPNGISKITTTTIHTDPDNGTTTETTVKEGVVGSAGLLGTWYVPANAQGSISGANNIPLFMSYNDPINYLNTGEGITNDTNTNGLENGNPTPTTGSREISSEYAGSVSLIANDIGTINKLYRKGFYVEKVTTENGTAYIPLIFGFSIFSHVLPTLNVMLDATNEFERNFIDTGHVYPQFDGVGGNFSEMNKIRVSNDDYTAFIFDNKEFLPFNGVVTDNYDYAETTFTFPCPIFDSREKLENYLLGVIDEDEAIDPDYPDNDEKTDTSVPVQNMVAGDGVNFTQ